MTEAMTSRRTIAFRVLLTVAILVLGGVLAFLLWMFRELEPVQPVTVPEQELEGMEWVRSIYGFGTSEDEQLYAPTSVAVGPDGRIYVTDPTRSRVLIFSPSGEYAGIIHTGGGGMGEGQFARPESIAVDELDRLYIADSWANKIIVFETVGGRYLLEWPVPGQARGVDVVGDEVFVLSMGRVFVYDKMGNPLYEFGRRGSEPGQIDAYQGITADDDHIYVADSFNRRIQAFTREGELVWARPLSGGESRALHPGDETASAGATLAAEGTATPESAGEEFAWDLPVDLAFDAAGRLVVVDSFRFELVTVDPEDGEVLGTYGEYGSEDGRFYYPSSVAYDYETDWFVVADTQNNRLQIVRLEESGGGVQEAVERLSSSPQRYVIYPLLVPFGLLVLIALVWVVRRIAGQRRIREHGRDDFDAGRTE